MAPGKFLGEAASLGQTFLMAVALGLCHRSASQPLTLPWLSFDSDGKLSQKKWTSPHSSEGTHPRHCEDVFIFTHEFSFKLCYKGREGGEKCRKFWGTLKTSF